MNRGDYPHLQAGMDAVLGAVAPDMARILDTALADGEVSVEQGARLFDAEGPALLALMATADELRRRAVGDTVTYVVNRNINFTNVCIKQCGFCAFSRDHRLEEGYFLPVSEVLRRARERGTWVPRRCASRRACRRRWRAPSIST